MRLYRSDAGWQELDEPNQAILRPGCIPAEPAAVSPGKIIVPRIVIGRVILEQPAGSGIGAAKRGRRVCGRVRRDLPVMPQPEAGVEKPQPIVVLHDCRMAGVVSHEKTLAATPERSEAGLWAVFRRY
jgi:hypothetical protein